jgi:hypothetical protein
VQRVKIPAGIQRRNRGLRPYKTRAVAARGTAAQGAPAPGSAPREKECVEIQAAAAEEAYEAGERARAARQPATKPSQKLAGDPKARRGLLHTPCLRWLACAVCNNCAFRDCHGWDGFGQQRRVEKARSRRRC